jgi:general secretion pathway protein F
VGARADDALARYCQQLGWMLDAGLGPGACLRALADEAPTERLRAASLRALGHLRRGRPLGQALAGSGAFPWGLRSALVATDQAGRLPAALETIAAALAARAARRRRLLGAASRHLPTLLITLLTLALLSQRVLPAIEQAFTGHGLPGLPLLHATVGALRWLSAALPSALALALLLWAASLLAYDHARQAIDRLVLALPWTRDLAILGATARYTWLLALLLSAGLPLLRALSLATDTVSNTWLALRLRRARALVQRGRTLSQALRATQAVDTLTASLVASGEQSGHLPEALARAADAAAQGVERRLAPLIHVVPALLSLLLAAAITLIGLSVLEPVRVLIAWLSRL